MSANVGLTTPRGSGTSGYVQRNLSTLKPRSTGFGQPYSPNRDSIRPPPKIRKPDEDILRHDRLRKIEVKVMELRDKLEDQGDMDDDEIEEECEKARTQMVADMEKGKDKRNDRGLVKSDAVHEMAKKEVESERLRRVLGLKKGEIGEKEDEEHPMARQGRRKREAEDARIKREDDAERRRRYEDED